MNGKDINHIIHHHRCFRCCYQRHSGGRSAGCVSQSWPRRYSRHWQTCTRNAQLSTAARTDRHQIDGVHLERYPSQKWWCVWTKVLFCNVDIFSADVRNMDLHSGKEVEIKWNSIWKLGYTYCTWYLSAMKYVDQLDYFIVLLRNQSFVNALQAPYLPVMVCNIFSGWNKK